MVEDERDSVNEGDLGGKTPMVTLALFSSDLHGRIDRYEKLWKAIEESQPQAAFLGGDLLPSGLAARVSGDLSDDDFVYDFLVPGFTRVRERLAESYPRVFVILGNDDLRIEEAAFLDVATTGLWTYAHNGRFTLDRYRVYGYSYVPPTPFMLKDWERYDVGYHVLPGCVSPEEGRRSVAVPAQEARYALIAEDLEGLVRDDSVDDAIFLFHSPPADTLLDRVATDGMMVDHVPLDTHVGSYAIRRFIERRQPLLTLHGHIHESARLTGAWRDRIGRTHLFSGAHDGDELALVRFDLEKLADASRTLL